MQQQINRIQNIIAADDSLELRRLLAEYDNQSVEVLRCVDEAGNGLIHMCAASCRFQSLDTILLSSSIHQSTLVQLINQSNLYGRTPLHLASFYGGDVIVEMLLKVQGIQIDQQTNAGCTPLYFACCRGHASIVDRLLKSGADPNARTKTASTPLIASTVSNDKTSILCLLNHDADINAQNNEGMTAMHVAADNGSKELFELLISRGGNQSLEDQHGRTPVDILLSVQKKAAVDASAVFKDTPAKQRHQLRATDGKEFVGGASPFDGAACSSDNNHISSTTNHTASPSQPTTETCSASSPKSNPISNSSSNQSQSPDDSNATTDASRCQSSNDLTAPTLTIKNLPIHSKASPVSSPSHCYHQPHHH